MPAGIESSRDEIIWHLDKKGIFKVKSTYHLAMEIKSLGDVSQSDQSKAAKEWKCLWNSRVLPRIKICAWKIINNIIPCKANNLKKGIDLNPRCSFYLKKLESTTHLIWECKISKQMWESFIPTSLNLFSFCRVNWSPKDYWSWMTENLNKEDMVKGSIIMWSIYGI